MLNGIKARKRHGGGGNKNIAAYDTPRKHRA